MWEREIRETMERVTREIIARSIKYSQKYGRDIFISKASSGRGMNVRDLDPETPEGRAALEAFSEYPSAIIRFTASEILRKETPSTGAG